MASPAVYAVEVDTDLDGTFDNALDDVTNYLWGASWSVGMDEPYQEVANPTVLELELDNSSGRFDVERSGAAFEGSLTPGMLVRVKMTVGMDTSQLWVGRVAVLEPLAGPKLERAAVRVRCVDLMQELRLFNFAPDLLTDVTTDVALASVFDAAPTAYPYEARWAMLGVTRLGVGSYLYESSGFIDFDTGSSTIAFAGAVTDGDREEDVSALAYIREVMDQEAGGRFYWDGRSGAFVFHSRHHDYESALLTPTALAMEGVEALALKMGDDIYNYLTFQWSPKALGTPNSVLYKADNVPFALKRDKTQKILARFRDPDNPSVRITAETVILPALGTHVVTSDDDAVAMAVNVKSTGVELEFISSADVEVTGITIRGTPLLSYNPETIIVLDVDSMAAYGRRSRIVSKKIQDQATANGAAAAG